MKERVRPYNHPDLQDIHIYIVCKKVECARINNQYLDSFPGDEIIVTATHFHKTQKKYSPFICKKEGTVGTTSFMDKLRLKIDCKVILIHNIDTSVGLTNGQLGKLIAVIRASDGSVNKCIVEFGRPSVGRNGQRRA